MNTMNDASSHRAVQRPRLRSILPADMYSALVRPDRAAPPSDPPSFPVYAEPSPEPIASSDAPFATAPKKRQRKTLNAFIFFSQHVRQHLPKEHQDKFRLRFDFTRFASCLWNRLSEETMKEWYARRDAAEDRCRRETGHDLVGNGTDYLVTATWRELVPEDVEKAAIYAFDHPDPAEVAKKQERKERKRKRQEERSAAAQRPRERNDKHRDCRKKCRVASPATSSTSSSPDNTPPPLTPPAYLSSASLSQSTLEDCAGLPQTPLPCTSDGGVYDVAALHPTNARMTYPSDTDIQHVYGGTAYPSEFVCEGTFRLPHVDRQSEPSLLSPVPQLEPQAVPQADFAYYHPTTDDHAFGSPSFEYEFTLVLESLRASSDMEAFASPTTYSYPVDPAYCFPAQPLPYWESRVLPATDPEAMSPEHFQDVLCRPAATPAGGWPLLPVKAAYAHGIDSDGCQPFDIAT